MSFSSEDGSITSDSLNGYIEEIVKQTSDDEVI